MKWLLHKAEVGRDRRPAVTIPIIARVYDRPQLLATVTILARRKYNSGAGNPRQGALLRVTCLPIG